MKDPPVVEALQIRYQDLDPYGHVNNAVYLEFFESARMAYWRELAQSIGIEERLAVGDIPTARYVIAEANIRYKAPLVYADTVFAGASIVTVGRRSFAMDFELRTGEGFRGGELAAEGSAAHAFYDPETGEVGPRPEWFLAAVAALEGVPEEQLAFGAR